MKKFTSWGFLKFQPIKKRHGIDIFNLEEFFASVELDHFQKDLYNYYNFLLKKNVTNIVEPERNPHVTAINHETITTNRDMDFNLQQMLNRMNGKCITFTYTGEVKSNGYHYWIPVESPQLERMRKFLGMPPKPNYDFHMTIGKIKEGKRMRMRANY